MLKLDFSFRSSLLVNPEQLFYNNDIAHSGSNREGVKPWGAAVKKQNTPRWPAS